MFFGAPRKWGLHSKFSWECAQNRLWRQPLVCKFDRRWCSRKPTWFSWSTSRCWTCDSSLAGEVFDGIWVWTSFCQTQGQFPISPLKPGINQESLYYIIVDKYKDGTRYKPVNKGRNTISRCPLGKFRCTEAKLIDQQNTLLYTRRNIRDKDQWVLMLTDLIDCFEGFRYLHINHCINGLYLCVFAASTHSCVSTTLEYIIIHTKRL